MVYRFWCYSPSHTSLGQKSTKSYLSNDKIVVGDGKTLPISHTGFASIKTFSNSSLSPRNVLYVPKISYKLVSVSKLCRGNNVFIEFHASHFLVKDAFSNKVILQGSLENGLYTI